MIHFKYRLGKSPGWAAATITDERAELTVPASYLCDALHDFVDALQRVFVTNSAECNWEEEPGLVQWEFRRSGLRLTVKANWDDGREGFAADDDLLRFSSEVDGELDGLLTEWGADRYLKQWHYPFPQEGHNKLKQAIKLKCERREATK